VYIKAIQENFQVKVLIPPTPAPAPGSRSSPVNVKIGVSGQKENVIKTKALIKELLMYHHTQVTHPGLEHVEVEIDPHFYNYIIGAKGAEIRHIQNNFKVKH
jgi:hypothetical protein